MIQREARIRLHVRKLRAMIGGLERGLCPDLSDQGKRLNDSLATLEWVLCEKDDPPDLNEKTVVLLERIASGRNDA